VKRWLLSLAVLALATPANALAGALTLYPSGFGAHSYAAWKAHQGLPDSTGNDDQSLYFQKMTATPTFAAGVAVIKGIAGTPATQLTGLAWDHREDGHCGAGAPRWNVNVHSSVTGNDFTVFFGCNAAAHQEKGVMTNGHGWCRDTQPLPPAAIATATGEAAGNLTITGLAIVFDEGNDTANPPPAPCAQDSLAGGFVYLDNIEVELNGVPHCWTGADDNGNQGGGACPDPPAAPLATSTSSLTLPTGLAVDPTDTELVTALNLAYTGVPLTSWLLYPNVIY
jgi:hypothetical protein